MTEQTQIEAFAEPEPAVVDTPPEPTIRVPLRELEDGQRVSGVYAVRERELRRKRDGDPWLRLSVGDASGSAEAVCWEEAEAHSALCCTGTAVFVSGVYEVSERWGPKIKISSMRAAEPDEFEADDLATGSDLSLQQLEGELRELLDTVQSPQLQQLLPLLRPRFGDLEALLGRAG